MLRKPMLISTLLSALLFGMSAGFAADPAVQNQAQTQIYGSQLMTPQERTEYQAKMRAANSPEAKEQIRAQHHQEMQVRAKQQGVTLPDEPPARGAGGGMGPGGCTSGCGGMGPGGRMGPAGGTGSGSGGR